MATPVATRSSAPSPGIDPSPRRVVVGLSGGVDSSVAALLLARAGHRVSGLFMKNWADDDTAEHCAAAADLADAQAVCTRLGITLHRADFSDQYRERVFAHFLAEHRAGRTPNPDVLCNREIKFRTFVEHARRLGAERVATGHYARLRPRDGRLELLRAADPDKDQSYFLHLLDQDQLACVWFPLGELRKQDVRGMARAAGLATHDKKDSTGICFIGEREHRAFLRRYLPADPGEIRTTDGVTIGTHEGLAFYTLGQRRGLGIGGRRGATDAPWYVVDKDFERNVLVVAQGHDHPQLQHAALRAEAVHWIAGEAPASPLRCSARIRYRQSDQACTVETEADRALVHFDRPQRAITPGQSVVFYAGEVCLGGGRIAAAVRADAGTRVF